LEKVFTTPVPPKSRGTFAGLKNWFVSAGHQRMSPTGCARLFRRQGLQSSLCTVVSLQFQLMKHRRSDSLAQFATMDVLSKYKNPPIQEAICEIHFLRSPSLRESDLRSMMPMWKDLYPDQKIVELRNVQIELTVEKAEAKPTVSGHKLICRSDNGGRLVQLSSSLLAVNKLRPYIGWEEDFRDTIVKRFDEARMQFGFESVNRIGLRYINRIEIPATPLVWSDWFRVPLPIPEPVASVGGFFQSHFRHQLNEHLDCILNFGSLPSEGKGSSVLLDIDVVWRGDIGPVSVKDSLESVHAPHRSLFEAYLLDKTRQLFNS
jgi:uncharacterized protein (TIGR04255 family)